MGSWVFPWSSFRVRACLFKRGEGPAPFLRSRTLGRRHDWRPRSRRARKGNPPSTEHEPKDLRKKTGRSIRCPARIRPQKSPNRFRAFGQADGRQPFMPRVSHNPCLLMLPFRFAHAMRMRPLSVGRVESAFHPATDHYREVQTFCKENVTKSFSTFRRSGPGTAPTLRVGHWVKRQSPAPSRRPLRVAAVRERRSGKPRRANARRHSPMAWRTCRSAIRATNG